MSQAKPRIVQLNRPPPARAWKSGEQHEVLSGWLQAARPPDVDIRIALRPLRARSREAAQNNDLMKSYLIQVKSNIIGATGIKLRSRIKFKNGKLFKALNAAHEMAWRKWSKRGSCDVTGQLSLTDVCGLAIETAAKDGEFLIRKVPWNNEFRYALQVIDPESLDVTYNEEMADGRRIVMGVELDEWRRPIAYHLTDEPSNPYMPSYNVHAKRERVPADEIIHGYLPEWCWQSRGVPWASASLFRMTMVGGYEEAAVTAARGGASKMAFYTSDAEAGPQMDGERNDAGDLLKDATPGSMEELPPGYDIKSIDWGWPNSDHGAFMRPVLRTLAAGLGVSYPSLAQDLEGVNYSSLRHGAIVEREIWRSMQRWAVEWLMQPIHDGWIENALMGGQILVDGKAPVQPPSAYDAISWRPRGWQSVDPQKAADAAARSLQMRTTSITRLMEEQGIDPLEEWEQLADDQEKLRELGIPIFFEQIRSGGTEGDD